MSDFGEVDIGDLTDDISTYKGQRDESGQRHGTGESTFANGDVYNGEYAEGKRHGRGCYTFKHAKYVGNYKNGKREGHGKMVYPDGSRYEGHWVEGERGGEGTYTYPNGDTFEGRWKNVKHGPGVYTYKDSGTKLIGEWNEGVREGNVEWVNRGHSYQGYMKKDCVIGRGRFLFNKNNCEQHGFYRVVDTENNHESVSRDAYWTCNSLLPTKAKLPSLK